MSKHEKPEPEKGPLSFLNAKQPEAQEVKAVEEPGLSFLDKAREIGGQMWDGAKPLFDHGRDEAAAALFSGHTHVPYGWNKAVEGEEIQVPKTPELEQKKEPDIEIEM